ncbi:hypothetical protein FRC12_023469 [Ceratobasidium sp. 428]|nr:hypothetical protein FRC12_023469 [Ceratobasidium sp. 428]
MGRRPLWHSTESAPVYLPYPLNPIPPISPYPFLHNPRANSSEETSIQEVNSSLANLQLGSPSSELPVPAPQYTQNGSATVSAEDIEYARSRLNRWQDEGLVMSQQQFSIKLSIEAPHHSAQSWGEICRESGLLYGPTPPAASQEENGLDNKSTEDTGEPSHDYAKTIELATTDTAQNWLASPH